MTVTLEIPSEMEVLVSENAALQGQAVSDYLLTLVETGLYEDSEMSTEEQDEEIAILQKRIQNRLSGDKGILLADYWADVLAKRNARTQHSIAENGA